MFTAETDFLDLRSWVDCSQFVIARQYFNQSMDLIPYGTKDELTTAWVLGKSRTKDAKYHEGMRIFRISLGPGS